jgi:glucosamine-phosphate N-acetyltransferase
MPENFIIRPIREGDIEVMYLLQQLSPTIHVDYARFTEFIYEVEGSSNHFVFVMQSTSGHRIVATGTIWIEPKMIHNFQAVGHIEDIVVDASLRGQGIGKCMIQELIDFAKNKNCYKVILHCDADKVEFYEKCGFEKRGVEMRYSME